MAVQTLEQFRSSFGSAPVEVDLPAEFATDGASSIYLKPLTSSARDEFEASIVGVKGERDLRNLRARLVARCWCQDESGKLMGTADEIGELRADFMGCLFDLVRHMNGMDSEDVEEAKNA